MGNTDSWRRSRSTNTSVAGQKRATSLSLTSPLPSVCRHFSFDVHLPHLRRAIAKLISVRGSTIELGSMPRPSATAKNSASPERRWHISSQNLLSFVIGHDLPNRVGATSAGRLVSKTTINLRYRRRLGPAKGGLYLKIGKRVAGAYNHCSDALAAP